MPWFTRFYDPIELPDGRKLLTLRDAAEYITALPKAEHDAADWQLAMETLSLAAERDGPEMLARFAVTQALSRHSPKATPEPRWESGKVWLAWGASHEAFKYRRRSHRYRRDARFGAAMLSRTGL